MGSRGLLAEIATTPELRALQHELLAASATGTHMARSNGRTTDVGMADGPAVGTPGIRVAARVGETPSEYCLTGVSASQKSLYIAAFFRKHGATALNVGPLLVITYSPAQADRLTDDLISLLSAEEVLLFPAQETWPHEEAVPNPDITRQRLQVMDAIQRRRGCVIVAPVQAMAERLMPVDQMRSLTRQIDTDSRLDLQVWSRDLAMMGYRRVDRVEERGEFSIRGGILDVFPVSHEQPVRVELFDDEIDSIRCFDPATQRSTDVLPAAVILPAREFVVPPEPAAAAEAIMEQAHRQVDALRGLDRAAEAEKLLARVTGHVEALTTGRDFPGLQQYKPFLYDRLDSLVDYVDGGITIMDEPGRAKDQLALFAKDFAETHSTLLERGQVLPQEHDCYLDWSALLLKIRTTQPTVYLAGLAKQVPGLEGVRTLQIEARTPELFHGRFERFAAAVQAWRTDGFSVLILLSTVARAERIAEYLREEGIPTTLSEAPAGDARLGGVVLGVGNLQTGCELPHARLVILTDNEVFGRQKQRRRLKAEEGVRITDFGDLREGDHVVHTNHGVGRYLGVETLEIAGVHKDYLVVKYAGEDKLYVPTEQVDLLQRYIGVEGQPPRLNKLGGNEWARVKRKVKESVQEMAQGLLKLYAEREALPGFAFAADSVWQQEFEDAFAYEETPDQWRAIQEVKGDMERVRPMDRLLCGDVGYGKTEVAIRAAFKAVTDGKQVAVLVPTTILAQQHHRTFEERFGGYPLRVEVMSRFQSQAEQKTIMDGLEQGTVDIVIGTHRLLSKDVKFKDLGLVVVDEEQRFGVAQKERLKELRKAVDVLTLTATPIPRTLHMSLVGARDMSLIETPPENRFPIRTYVVEHDDEVVREAILRELSRDGQVYFVHNRVQSIDRMAEHLMRLVPEARIAVAHGQMEEEKLERVMLDFLQGEYDVLLCSTIIETGMDIANVNTLIVYDADRMGLSQLYQLRGRVGRSNRVAYAYFTYRRDKILTEDAERRLQAIKEFTELGSGFKIAMRDLEIRGAGNILGPEQHGFIASVGFELYCKLLDESIRELKGEVVQQPPDPIIDLDVDAYITDSYIGDSQQKVEIYKKVVGIRSLEDAGDLAEELEDRFGELPVPVANLLTVARIKSLARQLAVQSIGHERHEIIIRFLPGVGITQDSALHLTRRYRGRLTAVPARTAQLKLRVRGLADGAILSLIEEVLYEARYGEAAAAAGQ